MFCHVCILGIRLEIWKKSFLQTSHKFHPCQNCCNHNVSQLERGPILSLQNSRNSLVTRRLNMWYPPHHESCLLWGNLPTTFFVKSLGHWARQMVMEWWRNACSASNLFNRSQCQREAYSVSQKKAANQISRAMVPSGPNWPKRSNITWMTKSCAKSNLPISPSKFWNFFWDKLYINKSKSKTSQLSQVLSKESELLWHGVLCPCRDMFPQHISKLCVVGYYPKENLGCLLNLPLWWLLAQCLY